MAETWAGLHHCAGDLNSGLYTSWVGTLPLEPFCQPCGAIFDVYKFIFTLGRWVLFIAYALCIIINLYLHKDP
jgi:hypothetical protein